MSASASPAPAPHFVQVGAEPVFIGEGAADLACACADAIGNAPLVRGFEPHRLLAIAIECAQCGAVTTTAGVPEGEIVPQGVRVVERVRTPMPSPFVLPRDLVIADAAEFLRVDASCRPLALPAEPIELSAATIAEFASAHDRLRSAGSPEHRHPARPGAVDATSPPESPLESSARPPGPPPESRPESPAGPGQPQVTLAWALDRLASGVGQPGWSAMVSEPDVVATAQLGAFREFLHVWSGHPLFPAMAAGAAAAGFSSHALAVFAAARCLAATGNRIGFTRPPIAGNRFDGFYVETSPTERTPVVVRRFDRFDWPTGKGADPAIVRAAAVDALIASQSRLHARQSGILVLSVGAVRGRDDYAIIEGLAETLRARGRKHRGLAGVAVILPKLRATARPDQVEFHWTFLPLNNPHHTGGGLRLGARPDGTPQVAAVS